VWRKVIVDALTVIKQGRRNTSGRTEWLRALEFPLEAKTEVVPSPATMRVQDGSAGAVGFEYPFRAWVRLTVV